MYSEGFLDFMTKVMFWEFSLKVSSFNRLRVLSFKVSKFQSGKVLKWQSFKGAELESWKALPFDLLRHA